MTRHIVAAVAVLAIAAPAGAEPVANPQYTLTKDGEVGVRQVVVSPHSAYATPDTAAISPIIFLNRCSGGCTMKSGNNDARIDTSTIPMSGPQAPGPTFPMGEFANTAGLIGAAADDEWNALVQCMKDVYSPFNVTITDQRPTTGSYHEAIIAGKPGDIGQGSNVLGVAPLASDCAAIDNVISFTFANVHPTHDRVLNICWTASQESAHAFGLDHEYQFADNASACNDPMTYRNDCGGEKFFRNEAATCGEFSPRACRCGSSQNSHLKVLSVFGPGTPITTPPTVSLVSPASTDTTLGRGVTVEAGAQRGVDHVDILFNGYPWTTVKGAAFQTEGQPNPSSYVAVVPTTLPDSVVDVQAVAYDDLGISTASATVTVTKGAPCANAMSCATGQKCGATGTPQSGKCFWDPPSGEIGDNCSYSQFCKSGLCTGTAQQQICTQDCIPGVADSCPSGLSCVEQSANSGVCFFSSAAGGGCCSVGDAGGGWWVHGGVAAIVLGLMRRRRRFRLASAGDNERR